MPIKHTFVSPVVDENDPDIVGPDDWNDDHDLSNHTLDEHSNVDESGASDGQFLQRQSGIWVPHSLVKGDVGLGNVENFTIASQAEAEAGTANDKYMTPLRTEQATADLATDADLSSHENNTSNPHSVTAAQAGADPAGSADAVQTNLDTHEADTSNPHSVTADQVGSPSDSEFTTHTGDADAHKGQKNSIEVDTGDLQLVGDSSTPGNDKRYGTDGSGNLGFFDISPDLGWDLIFEGQPGSDTASFDVSGLNVSGGSGIVVFDFVIWRTSGTSAGTFNLETQFYRGGSLVNLAEHQTRERLTNSSSETTFSGSTSAGSWPIAEIDHDSNARACFGRIVAAQQGSGGPTILSSDVVAALGDSTAGRYLGRAVTATTQSGLVDGIVLSTSDSASWISSISILRVRWFRLSV